MLGDGVKIGKDTLRKAKYSSSILLQGRGLSGDAGRPKDAPPFYNSVRPKRVNSHSLLVSFLCGVILHFSTSLSVQGLSTDNPPHNIWANAGPCLCTSARSVSRGADTTVHWTPRKKSETLLPGLQLGSGFLSSSPCPPSLRNACQLTLHPCRAFRSPSATNHQHCCCCYSVTVFPLIWSPFCKLLPCLSQQHQEDLTISARMLHGAMSANTTWKG